MSLSDFFQQQNPSLFASRAGRFAWICLILICAACNPVTFAQEPENSDEVLRVSTDLLVFPIRVRQKNKQPAASLNERDLVLTDRDQVTAGLYLMRGVDRVALLFALDRSGSILHILLEQRNAALELFSRFGERSQVAVLRFAETPSLVVPFGRDTKVVRDAFSLPIARNRRTAIFDAAAVAVASFGSLPRVRSERRIVILLSDGLDNASRTKANAVIESAIAHRVSFYVIHIPLFGIRDGRLAVRPAANGFRELAEKTGGRYFLAGDPRLALSSTQVPNLDTIFQAIEDDLRSQFLLGFYLSESANDGRRHEFSLALPEGLEYQVSGRGFARKHKFFVANPRKFLRQTAR